MNLRSAVRHRLLTSCLIAGGIAFGATSRLCATNYYVDYAAGNDANPGTSTSSPWRHCPGDPSASNSAATTSLAAGDKVTFKGGVTYVITGATGIILRSSGTAGTPITFDGNSDNTWGSGRAKFSDNNGANGVAAFSASSAISNLSFSSLEFGQIGGASILPSDAGSGVPARFGGGLVFAAAATNITIDGCSFHDLGYSFNQKPMAASSISGVGVSFVSCDTIAITNCDFSHVGSGIEMYDAASVSNVTITGCTFHDYVCWTIDLPAAPVTPTNLSVSTCSETNNSQFDPASWTGYGISPRIDTQTVAAGSTVQFTATAAATPSASFQWRKNGTNISGATSSALTLNAVTTADAATYTVVATNSAGATTSNDSILAVTVPTTATSAPVITNQPVSIVGAPYCAASMSIGATGNPIPTYQWYKNGVAVSAYTNATLTFSALTSNDAGTFKCVVSNSAGSATSDSVTVTVQATSSPTPTPSVSSPVITKQPVSVVGVPLGAASVSVQATGSPAPAYQWYKNGVAIAAYTNATVNFSALTSNDAGTFKCVVSNSAGSVTSNSVTVTLQSSGSSTTVTPSTSAPVITKQPVSVVSVPLGTASLSVSATGNPAPKYQWYKNSIAITAYTNATLKFSALTTNDVATYKCVVSNGAGSVTSNSVTVTLGSASKVMGPDSTVQLTDSELTNLSVRGAAGTGSNTLIVGFVVSGNSDKSLLVRGVGPTLGAFNVSRPLPDPKLSLYCDTTAVGSNSGWSTGIDGTQVASVSNAVGAFALPTGSQDAALVPTLAPGIYTAQITSSSNQSGTAMLELYDPAPSLDNRLVNVSARTTVTVSDMPIIGFTVSGTTSKQLLIRAIGPGLGKFGVQGSLADPKLEIYRGSSRIQENDNWGGTAELTSAFDAVNAFPIEDPASKDAALVINAAPGTYTAVVSGVNGSEGVVIVEVYELQ